MKRIGIPVALVLAISSAAHAQTLEGYGAKVGVFMANQDFDYTFGFGFDTNDRTGFDIGVYAEWLDLAFFSLLTEVHYIQKGMEHEERRLNEFGEELAPRKWDSRVDYLSIPILAKITIQANHVSPYFIMGPRIDLFLGYNSDLSGALYDEFERVDIGGDFGIGVGNNSGPMRMLLEFRYSPDFSNAYKTDLLKVKNNSFEILFGLGFQR
jgi:hypothetical protein